MHGERCFYKLFNFCGKPSFCGLVVLFVCEGVWKVFGSTVALAGVDVVFEGRGFHFLLGPNGSGKSTLLRLFSGLLKPSRGKVSVFGFDPWRFRDRVCSRVCFVFEDVGLPWWFSGKDFLRFVVSVSRSSWERMVDIARRLGVDGFWDKSIRGYSTGMRKKLLLAAGIGRECEAYVFDEPFSGLDVASIGVVLGLLEELARDHLVLVTTHIGFRVPSELTRSVVVLVGGKVVFTSSSIGQECFVCSRDTLDQVYEAVRGSRELLLDISGKEILVCAQGANLEHLGCKSVLDPIAVYESVMRNLSSTIPGSNPTTIAGH